MDYYAVRDTIICIFTAPQTKFGARSYFCTCLSFCSQVHPPARYPPEWYTPQGRYPQRAGTAPDGQWAGSTHPTGMHSRFNFQCKVVFIRKYCLRHICHKLISVLFAKGFVKIICRFQFNKHYFFYWDIKLLKYRGTGINGCNNK